MADDVNINGSVTSNGEDAGGRRMRAYRVASEMARERMRRETPEAAAALERVGDTDIVVVPGCYDHVEQVLGALGLPFAVLDPSAIHRAALRPEQLLVVNCPGSNVGRSDIVAVREFVAAGGSLFTTDWALRHVIEPAFPGLIAYNDRPTRDDVVRIEVVDRANPFLAGVLDGADDPQWWLEASSYPIRILDPDRVKVLITSREMADKYGEAPIAVLFRHGEGEVFHMASHYYLQRTELRSARHAEGAAAYAAEKGVAFSPAAAAAAADLALADIEAAHSSARLFANVVAAKKLREARR